MEPSLANLAAVSAASKHIVAWQGVRIVLPDDWEPGAFSGDWGGGHLRIDERLEPRLVVRWLPKESTDKLFRRASSRQAAIDELADNYLESLERTHKKKRRELQELYRQSTSARNEYKEGEKQIGALNDRRKYHEDKAARLRSDGERLIAEGSPGDAETAAEQESRHQSLSLDYEHQAMELKDPLQ